MLDQYLFSSYLVGEDSLVIQCAEILLARNHNILGIISPLHQISEWALKHHIPYFKSLNLAEESLANNRCDYLFSVVNSEILPQSIFNCCRQLTINFHNSPLPRLAGGHATSWAILNNEKQHAITWHIINSMIDGGDILKQVVFNIDENETELSLNLKCYQYAVKAFSELVDELANKTYRRFPQDLSKRTYYGFNKKPPRNGLIFWQDSAENIDRLCRALYLGQYNNRFSVPKLMIDNDVFVVDQWKLGEKSKKPAGTLVKVAADRFEIATATNNFILLQISTLKGEPCDFKLVAKEHHLAKNHLCEFENKALFEEFEEISTMLFKHERFWVEELTRFNAASLPFLIDNFLPHPHRQCCVETYFLPEALSKELKQLYADVPLTTIILTAWLVYLYRLGNQENLGVGFYDRSNFVIPPELSPFFPRKLPFSVCLEDDMNFIQSILCIQQKRDSLEAHLTYEQSVIRRYPALCGAIKFFPVAVLITDEPETKFQKNETTSLVTLILSTDGKKLSWFADSHVLKSEPNLLALMKRFPSHLSNLFESVAKDPSLKITELNLLPSEEKQQILFEWNQIESDYPKNQSIASLYEAQTNLTPNSIALLDENDGHLSYSEVNRLANQLARYLERKGLQEGMSVAICSGRDLQTIISILAILKLGAVYIPIDFSAPPQHIQSILEDSKPQLIIMKKQESFNINPAILGAADYQIIELEKCKKAVLVEDHNDLNRRFSSESLASIVYTSGTTGKPKGVMITHAGIIRLVINTNYIAISSKDRFAQAASISFDAAIFEIWGALLNGASLVCVSKEALLNPKKFASFLEQRSITILWLTSALFDQYALIDASMFRKLNYLLVGGDVLNKETIKMVLECPKGRPRYILNGYGPTENTTFTTTHLISKKSIMKPRIPIGRPIKNTTTYILDRYLNLMPVGMPGELYVGGVGLSKGYINKPEMTKEKFIPNFFSKNPEDKLYKTGDIVCWLPDGDIDYLGRKDKQVKIRGFRVELEAIQSYMLEHKDISQCFIQIYDDSQRGKILVVYIVLHDGIKLAPNNLRKFLSQRFPDYMVPSDFIVLKKLPLTENGKVNYRALPLPNSNKKLGQRICIAAKNTIQKKLVTIWCNLLKLNEVSIDDSFFALGGHSLLLTKLILELKESFGFELLLHDFLKKPTIIYLEKLIKNKISIQKELDFSPPFLKDTQLDSFIRKKEFRYQVEPIRSILLTGATGFLGIHLLSDLYQNSSAALYCLVRAESEREAKERLKTAINKYQLNIQLNERIIPIVSDIEKPCLGMPKHQFMELAKKIDAIYHNAAYVHHLYNYKMLRAANVLGTVELLKLATLVKTKPFYYISTLSAVGDNTKAVITENFPSSDNVFEVVRDGYNQTKRVSECLIAQASKRGLPVKIYRPGWILGQSNTGAVSAEKNHLLLLIKGCIQMGCAPNWQARLSILPVDFLSHLIIDLSVNTEIKENIFNLANPNIITWLELMNYINHFFYKVDIVSVDVWKDKYLKNLDQGNALFNLLTIYATSSSDWVKNLDDKCNVDDSNTEKALKKLNLKYPSIDNILLDKYFTYLIKTGFFPKAQLQKNNFLNKLLAV